MGLLTLENLSLNSLPYADYREHTRGRKLYDEGYVRVKTFEGSSVACEVGSTAPYHIVSISAVSSNRLRVSCGCRMAQTGYACQHIVAAILAARNYVENVAERQWQYTLNLALERTPKPPKKPRARSRCAVLFGFSYEKRTFSGASCRIQPYLVKARDWAGVDNLENLRTSAERNAFLDHNRGWTLDIDEAINLANYQVVNLSEEAVQLTILSNKISTFMYYHGAGGADQLELLARLNVPVFRVEERGGFKELLTLHTEPVQIEAGLVDEGDHYTLEAGVVLDGNSYNTFKKNLQILATTSPWLLAGKHLAPVANAEALNLLDFLPMNVPKSDEREFRDRFLPEVLERIPVHGTMIQYVDVAGDPIPRLYLREDKVALQGSLQGEQGTLRADLRFAYSGYEVEADPKAAPEMVQDIAGSWDILRIHRQNEQEQVYYQMLTDARYGLKRAGGTFPPCTFEIRARTHPLDFLLRSIPLLAAAGFEIFGEDNLKDKRINRSKPTISLSLSSGIDWFDLNAVIQYGDQQVPLKEMRRALAKRERYIKLADGSIGQIPDEWLEKYKKLFDLAEETDSGLRVHDYHLPLVDTLLADASEAQVAAEFKERRERLRGFENIAPQPIPQGFQGDLRPYQKAGLDWLHFLHQYGFGGILADDMGLGKTIQVLAFLQSLREQGRLDKASLLVVPKSLIANWLREAERFTPGLRFLEYTGNFRKKETSVFDNYDVILTTYGTMLRDIESLRGYPFDYVILDESQNIKNPLAQSSKAARLLNTRHRLVMTGTPVENNTFELWSQFAFLNPGLLGSLEYFKKEFATPIESQSSEETIQTLRRLVYPFILRRTKEQVAPELPERTERILYTDFAPAQRKLYNHTRDQYRSMLTGLTEGAGINDIRMKILEGLLRLRQICIHPALIDPAYHGDAPKFELLLETLESLRVEKHKALVFSQFVKTLHILRRELDARQIPYTYLDGQTNNRQEQVDRFQNDPGVPFFLISLKAGGVGLNLTAADYVIHIDPWWNPAVEMQAADRAHRIGQDKPVFIYKIIARDSVEEKILLLQEKKKELVDQIISEEGAFFKNLTPDDIKQLFS